MMTALPEKAMAATATSIAPTRRESRCGEAGLDAVCGGGEPLGFVVVVLGLEKRALRGEQQRFHAVRCPRGARIAGRATHLHTGELELNCRMDGTSERVAGRIGLEAV